MQQQQQNAPWGAAPPANSGFLGRPGQPESTPQTREAGGRKLGIQLKRMDKSVANAQFPDSLVCVSAVIPGGTAARCRNIMPEDCIVAVNGETLVNKTAEEAQELLRGELGSYVTLDLVRKAKVGTGTQQITVVLPRGLEQDPAILEEIKTLRHEHQRDEEEIADLRKRLTQALQTAAAKPAGSAGGAPPPPPMPGDDNGASAVVRLRAEIARLTLDNENLRADLLRPRGQLEPHLVPVVSDHELEKLRNEMALLKGDNIVLRVERDALQAQRTDTDKLKQYNVEMKTQLDSLHLEAAKAHAMIAELRAQRPIEDPTLRSENEKMKIEIADLRRELISTTEMLKQSLASRGQVSPSEETLRRENDYLRQLIEEKDRSSSARMQNVDELFHELVKSRETLVVTQSHVTQLEDENDKLSSKLGDLQREIDRLRLGATVVPPPAPTWNDSNYVPVPAPPNFLDPMYATPGPKPSPLHVHTYGAPSPAAVAAATMGMQNPLPPQQQPNPGYEYASSSYAQQTRSW